MADVVRGLTGFARELRQAGLKIGAGQLVALARGLATLDPNDREDLYWAGRACLVTRREDIPVYDVVFGRVFDATGQITLTVAGTPPPRGDAAVLDLPTSAPRRERPAEEGETGVKASDLEILRDKDFARYTDEEAARARELLAGLRLATPLRRTRRTVRARKGPRPDLRRALRDIVRQEHRLPRAWRAPTTKPRTLVLLLDISGSMKAYSRMLVQFAHVVSRGDTRVEVFCFGTRLTRITGQLADRDPDEALRKAAATVIDWDGGTRIGESIGEYTRTWGRRAGFRGALTVLCSDGLERGDPERLGREMQRLQRLSHRVLWLNPLKSDPHYEPLTRGMKAALPAVDFLLSGHSLGSLEELVDVLGTAKM
ncbi:MAG TPA: VWA domain-containing protein [Mycobacteriales bacterium]|nr:VWA domain-containing protein [Mycobacteriales bacterium]